MAVRGNTIINRRKRLAVVACAVTFSGISPLQADPPSFDQGFESSNYRDVAARSSVGRPKSVDVSYTAMADFFSNRRIADSDGDGVSDDVDNCSQVANADQLDTDGDGFGNICDADLNNDGFVNFIDLGILKASFFSTPASANWNPDADLDGNGFVNFIDLGIMKAGFFQPPGPGAVPSMTTYTADVQPIFSNKCAPCHTGLGIGGHDLGTTYPHAFLPAAHPDCTGLNKGQCTIVRILSGDMPKSAGCTGDPALDAGNPACLTQIEQDTVQAWIDDGLPN